jgi:hypothetical protein
MPQVSLTLNLSMTDCLLNYLSIDKAKQQVLMDLFGTKRVLANKKVQRQLTVFMIRCHGQAKYIHTHDGIIFVLIKWKGILVL